VKSLQSEICRIDFTQNPKPPRRPFDDSAGSHNGSTTPLAISSSHRLPGPVSVCVAEFLLERWRGKHGRDVADWLETTACLEASLSVAGYSLIIRAIVCP